MIGDILSGGAVAFVLALLVVVNGHAKAQRRANRTREIKHIETEVISYG